MKSNRTSNTTPARPGSCRGASRRLRFRVPFLALLLLVSQLIWPLAALARPVLQPTLVPISGAELASVLAGCFSNCDGGDDSSDTADEEEDPEPTRVGSTYWSYAYRTLIERPEVPGDLIWHRINSTDSPWGPFEVSFQHREKYSWSIGASVPRSLVSAQLGSEYERVRTETVSFTIPPQTYYKFFVAYPYERWRYYYNEYQDYSDGSRQVVDSGSATVYDLWTKTHLVPGPA